MLGNIRKTVISVLCICFTVMLIFVSINTYISFQRMRLYDAYDAYGEYNIVLHNITMEQYNWIKESYTEEAKIGVENIVEVMETGINILKCDDRSIEMNRYRMSEGNFPIKQNEVAISATAKKEGRYIINNYEIGDRIELGKSSFIISGIIDDYDYSTVDTYKIAITAGDISSDSYNVYLHFYAKQDYINAIPNILDNFGLEKEDICEEGKREGFLGTYKLILNSDLRSEERRVGKEC